VADRRVVAIHQPNFFPWLGYFDKLARADTFVLLDGVQFARRHGGGGNWVNRVRVLVAGVASWITAPVKRANIPLQSIAELEIADDMPWRAQLLRTLKVQYSRASHFAEAMDLITPLVQYPAGRLSEFNCHAIGVLAKALDVVPPALVRQTELGVSGHSNDLLVDVVKAVKGATYLSGDGADGYLKAEVFEQAGIRLAFQHFQQPEYPQGTKAFVAGLSIIDVLMHCGVARARELVKPARVGEGAGAE
jgi:hypothetical protein